MYHRKTASWQNGLLKVGQIWLITLVVGIGLVTVGCRSNEPTPISLESLTIGLAISNLENPFFVSLQQGAAEAANRLNIELLVENAQDDPVQQKSQIESLITRPVSALIINPIDSNSLLPLMQSVNETGIPIFTVDRAINSQFVVSHIASDNVAGGQMAADYVSELLQGAGKVVELQGLPGTSATIDRGLGFQRGLSSFSDITIVAQMPADFDRQKAQAVFAQILAEQPDIDAVFAQNDEMVLGAIEAAKAAGRDNDIYFVGFDAISEAITALDNGQLDATIAQQPTEMGRLSVETAFDYLHGKSVAQFIMADLALITH